MPSAAVRGLVPASSTPRLAAPAPQPKASAAPRDRRPVGSGRPCVRFMSASSGASDTWLKVLAEAAARAVPLTAAAKAAQSTGVPASRKPAPDVTTTSADSRALHSSP